MHGPISVNVPALAVGKFGDAGNVPAVSYTRHATSAGDSHQAGSEQNEAAWPDNAIGKVDLAQASVPPGDVLPAPSVAKPRRHAEPAAVLDPRLRPFAHALADLLLADLLKYPPKA
jgi:hypothetical protein